MQTRGTDAIPFPPRPNLEQYKKQAKEVAKACKSGASDAIRSWAAKWLEALARLHSGANSTQFNGAHLDREVERIEEDAPRSGMLNSETANATCTLANAQLFIARLHGFESWPKFSQTHRGIDSRQPRLSHNSNRQPKASIMLPSSRR
jgi:hypothetical protein